jgi:hypothetical protein
MVEVGYKFRFFGEDARVSFVAFDWDFFADGHGR